MTLLEINNLFLDKERKRILKDISFNVEKGMAVTIIGKNGVGKSSLLRAIMGLERGCHGQIFFRDQNISNWSPSMRVRNGIGFLPEGRKIFPNLTVRENLRLGGFFLSNSNYKKAQSNVLELFPILQDRLAFPAATLSGGEQQMLAICRILIAEPRLLLLDELSQGLAPLVIKDIYGKLEILKIHGVGMIIVEQNKYAIQIISEKKFVIRSGEMCLQNELKIPRNVNL